MVTFIGGESNLDELLPFSLFWGIVMLMLVLGFVTYAIYFERKVIGWMQMRIGPNRTGPFGLLQSVADVLKLLIKEDTIPNKAERELFHSRADHYVYSFVRDYCDDSIFGSVV